MNYIGIDIGGTNIKGAIISKTGKILDFKNMDCKQDGREILNTIINLIESLKNNNPDKSIKAIGIGTPGVVDVKFGGVIDGCPNIKGWKGIKFIPIIKNKFNLPVFAHNDVTIMAVGENMFGSAKGKKNVICVALGTGIGGGIIINEQVYDGHTNYAGEIGHMIIEVNGRDCNCGSKGCWEAYAGAIGIKNTAKEIMPKYAELTPKELFALANKDEAAKKIIDKTILYIAVGIANLINIFNPEMIVIGGGISQAGDALFKPLLEITPKYTMNLAWKSCKIAPAKFDEKSGVIGAAGYAVLLSSSLFSASI